MEQEGLVIDPLTKEWTGELPANCRSVILQFLNTCRACKGTGKPTAEENRKREREGLPKLKTCLACDGNPGNGEWLPKHSAPRTKSQGIEEVEKALKKGPNFYLKYRVIPAPNVVENNNNEEGDEMATKKKAAKKAAGPKTPSAPKELVGGLFREGSHKANIFKTLSDKKVHTLAELTKACPGADVKGRIAGTRDGGHKAKTFTIIGDEKAGYQMKPYGTKPDAPAAPKEKETKAAKTNGKAAAESKKPAAKKAKAAKASAGSSPAPAAEAGDSDQIQL